MERLSRDSFQHWLIRDNKKEEEQTVARVRVAS